MIIEVIAGQIAENPDGKIDSFASPLIQRDAGDFHRRMRRPASAASARYAISFDAAGVVKLASSSPRQQIVFDRPEQRGRVPAGLQDCTQQIAERAFAIRTGDAGDPVPSAASAGRRTRRAPPPAAPQPRAQGSTSLRHVARAQAIAPASSQTTAAAPFLTAEAMKL